MMIESDTDTRGACSSRELWSVYCYESGREWGTVSPKTGAAERRLGSRKPPVGRMFRLIPVIDQTHLSFQRGQEAWLAGFEKWWGRKQRSSFSSQNYVQSSIKC